MRHGLVALKLYSPGPTRPLCVCACGCIAGGKPGVEWNVTEHGDGTASASPSFDWKGHFHVVANHVPIMQGLPANLRTCRDEVNQ